MLGAHRKFNINDSFLSESQFVSAINFGAICEPSSDCVWLGSCIDMFNNLIGEYLLSVLNSPIIGMELLLVAL